MTTGEGFNVFDTVEGEASSFENFEGTQNGWSGVEEAFSDRNLGFDETLPSEVRIENEADAAEFERTYGVDLKSVLENN